MEALLKQDSQEFLINLHSEVRLNKVADKTL